VAREISPIAKPREIHVVPELPKTRSGKIMRRLLRDVAEGRERAIPRRWWMPVCLRRFGGRDEAGHECVAMKGESLCMRQPFMTTDAPKSKVTT
jgi:AMP-binding enzyme C-terminal domain